MFAGADPLEPLDLIAETYMSLDVRLRSLHTGYAAPPQASAQQDLGAFWQLSCPWA